MKWFVETLWYTLVGLLILAGIVGGLVLLVLLVDSAARGVAHLAGTPSDFDLLWGLAIVVVLFYAWMMGQVYRESRRGRTR